MIVDYIKLWRYVSLRDGAIDEHELVSISFHLAQEFPRETLKDELEKLQDGIEEEIDTTFLERVKEKYEPQKRIKLLLSLYLFFLHEEDLNRHPRMKEIFDALGVTLEDFENIFSDAKSVANIPHLHFYKKIIKHDFFQGFEYVLFELEGEYRFVLRKGENLFIDGHPLRGKNRAILLNEKQEFEFRNKNFSLTLSFKEMIVFLKDQNRSELFDKIEQKSEVKTDTIEKITKIDMKNLDCGFDKKKSRTKNLNICLKQGDLVAIIGPSGSGKSTLLKTIMGMNYIHGGSLTINDTVYKQGDEEKLSEYIRYIGYVSQQELFVRELSVHDNLYYYYSLFYTKRDKETFTKEMEKILKQLGIYKQLHQQTSSLSGGQRKKLNIALELIKNPDVLFIDEPTSGLSSQEALELIEFLRELSLEGKMVFTVIHQPSLEMYKQYTKVIILNQEGDNIYSGDAQQALDIFCSVLSQNNEDADPNILLKTTKAHDDFWYTLGHLKRFLGVAS